MQYSPDVGDKSLTPGEREAVISGLMGRGGGGWGRHVKGLLRARGRRRMIVHARLLAVSVRENKLRNTTTSARERKRDVAMVVEKESAAARARGERGEKEHAAHPTDLVWNWFRPTSYARDARSDRRCRSAARSCPTPSARRSPRRRRTGCTSSLKKDGRLRSVGRSVGHIHPPLL